MPACTRSGAGVLLYYYRYHGAQHYADQVKPPLVLPDKKQHEHGAYAHTHTHTCAHESLYVRSCALRNPAAPAGVSPSPPPRPQAPSLNPANIEHGGTMDALYTRLVDTARFTVRHTLPSSLQLAVPACPPHTAECARRLLLPPVQAFRVYRNVPCKSGVGERCFFLFRPKVFIDPRVPTNRW